MGKGTKTERRTAGAERRETRGGIPARVPIENAAQRSMEACGELTRVLDADTMLDIGVHILDPAACAGRLDLGWGTPPARRSGVGRVYQPASLARAIAAILPVRAMVLFAWGTGVTTVRFEAKGESRRFGTIEFMEGRHVWINRAASWAEVSTTYSNRLGGHVQVKEAGLAVYLHECGHAATFALATRRGGYFDMTRGESIKWEQLADAWAGAALRLWRSGFGGDADPLAAIARIVESIKIGGAA